MTIETFNWRTSASLSTQTKFNVASIVFADGYEQVASRGLNPVSSTWTVSVTSTHAEIGAVEQFLDRHAGAKSFYWNAPRKGRVLVRSQPDAYTTSENGGATVTLSTTFKQVLR